MNCLFCKIIKKEIPAEIIYEDNDVISFLDIHPKAPFHCLIVPKKHIPSLREIQEEEKFLLGAILLAAQKIAEEKEFSKRGYKLVFNVGRGGGQVIEHLHLHLLSGKPIKMP